MNPYGNPAANGSNFGTGSYGNASAPVQPNYGQNPYGGNISSNPAAHSGNTNSNSNAINQAYYGGNPAPNPYSANNNMHNNAPTFGSNAQTHAYDSYAAGPYGAGGGSSSYKPVTRDEGAGNVMPIAAINPYSNRCGYNLEEYR